MMTTGNSIVPSQEELRLIAEREMKNAPEMGVYFIESDAEYPEKATDGSACFDIKAYIGDINKDNATRTEIKAFDMNNTKFTLEANDERAIVIPPWCRVLIPTGLICDIPDMHSMRLHPRSGMSFKYGVNLANQEGVIDNDYVEELFVALFNKTDVEYRVKHGDKIAQAELERTIKFRVKQLQTPPARKTERSGGFGHTGR